MYCDDIESGTTQSAGAFTCPAGTQLSRISGGYDVGTDEVATTGTVAFTGVLTAPASEPYVTPMTTLVVALVQNGQSDEFVLTDADYAAAQASLAQTLGVSVESLNANPVVDTEAAKSNAQVHQVLAAFSPNVEGYEEATAAFAQVIADSATTGGRINLSQDTSVTLAAVNSKLSESGSDLEMATVDLDQAILNVVAAVTAIESAESPARVNSESQKALIDQAPVTIVRRDAEVMLSTEDLKLSQTVTMDSFENPVRTDGRYTARLYSGMTRVDYDNDVFQFNQSINNARVTVAFELTAVEAGDDRSISFVSDDVVVSAIRDRSESLVVSMLSGDSTFQVLGTDSEGVTTDAVIETDGETISSDGDTFSIDLERINGQLADLGFEDILATSGDYVVTLVISGLRINEQDGNETSEASVYTVNTGAGEVTGNGFRGYVSIVR